MDTDGQQPTRNYLLDSLDPADREELTPLLRPVEFSLRDVLAESGEPLKEVLFVTAGMVSLVTTMEDGSSVEMAAVGREGVVCVPSVLGSATTMNADAIAQMPARGLSMEAGMFLERATRSGGLRDAVDRYTHALFVMVSQNAACNRLHTMEERASRWLLMARDRADSDTFPMTHEFLSQMLGARRATVTEVAQDLQDRGAIHYHRGQIEMLDRSRLEATACECYEIVSSVFDGLYE